jgi:hypothetical protein
MHQEHKPNFGEVPNANTYGVQDVPADLKASSEPGVTVRKLEWMGPRAFKAQYGAQPGVDRDIGMGWGSRRNQRVSHRRAALDALTGLLHAYDLTWDEYAVLAADVPATAVEAVNKNAVVSDIHMSPEAFAGLLADHLAATPDLRTTTLVTAGVER